MFHSAQILHDKAPNLEHFQILKVLSYLQYGIALLFIAACVILFYYSVWFMLERFYLVPMQNKLLNKTTKALKDEIT